MLLLGRRIDAQRLFRLLADIRLRGRSHAVEPGQRLLDFVRFKTHRRQLAGQLVVVGAGIGPPVVFVQVHEHIEHGLMILQHPQARATRWNNCPGSLETLPASSRSSSRTLSSAADTTMAASKAS